MANRKLQTNKGREGKTTWLIFPDDYTDDKPDDYIYDNFFGTHNDAFAYAYKKYGKKFTMWEKKVHDKLFL